MNDLFSLYNIIFLVIAVVIFLRLRSVLGKRTGNERPPFDPYSSREANGPADTGDKVITLPRRTKGGAEDVAAPLDTAEEEERLANVAPKGSALETALKTVLAADRSFDPAGFLNGAKAAYEMIVTA
ncbi:MAG: Tim44/TimA family putative adaptor protein, partial [Hyphomicrobiales bacterium]|nr:Tim44/TimA family putative adaptor protein [Hyphomicrobiales bacterium]